MHVSLRFEAPGSERRHIVGKGLHRQLPIACRSQSKTNRATLLWGALTMAVDFKSPPLQLLTGALADWLFFKCFSGLGTSVDLTFARPPSRCGATGRSVCAQIALVSSPHTTLGRSTPGGGGTLLARGLLLPPCPVYSISYLAPRTGSNLGTPRGAPAHSCTSQRASIVEREVHRRTGKCRHPSCATLAGGTAVNDCSALV